MPAPTPALILVDRALPATITWSSPSGLAVISLRQGEHAVDTVVQLHAVKVLPEYQAVADQVVMGLLKPGHELMVQGSATAVGGLGEIPVVDVLLAGQTTLGEHLIRLGYAVPDESLLSSHIRSQAMTDAVTAARAAGVGMWVDHTPNQAGLSAGLAVVTTPPAPPPVWFASAGFAMLLIMVLLAGVRAHYYRRQREAEEESERAQALAAGASPDAVKPGVIRRTSRFLFGLPPGMLRPIRSDQVRHITDPKRPHH